MSQVPVRGIGTVAETSLHAALRQWYRLPGDKLETEVDGYLIDIVRGELLIEIQTGNFASVKTKLMRLASRHPVRVVYPVPREKWIVYWEPDRNTTLMRRRSPKQGRPEELFRELVSFPRLVIGGLFSLEVLLTQEEELRCQVGPKHRHRKRFKVVDRNLLRVENRIVFSSVADYLGMLPEGLGKVFTTADLADALQQGRSLAQKMAYCLRGMDAITVIGKEGNALLYARSTSRAKSR